MIQANELRIGNWYDHNGSYRQVTPNTIEEVWEDERIYVNPIPLTPEILEKCGFVWSHLEEEYVLTSKVGVIFLSKDGYSVSTGTNDSFIRIFGLTCKYLHQLQNLYFALTGEELNVQL